MLIVAEHRERVGRTTSRRSFRRSTSAARSALCRLGEPSRIGFGATRLGLRRCFLFGDRWKEKRSAFVLVPSLFLGVFQIRYALFELGNIRALRRVRTAHQLSFRLCGNFFQRVQLLLQVQKFAFVRHRVHDWRFRAHRVNLLDDDFLLALEHLRALRLPLLVRLVHHQVQIFELKLQIFDDFSLFAFRQSTLLDHVVQRLL
mmetsp:Transcript_8331/g.33181  ORF Transcript_8331/g.33181 Transcript_8331/m.33181 type:complete len:202 (+) Transcript_8331:3344-3949(+)